MKLSDSTFRLIQRRRKSGVSWQDIAMEVDAPSITELCAAYDAKGRSNDTARQKLMTRGADLVPSVAIGESAAKDETKQSRAAIARNINRMRPVQHDPLDDLFHPAAFERARS